MEGFAITAVITTIIVVVFIVVVIAIAAHRRAAEKRKAAMSAVATQLNLEFHERPPDSLLQRLSGLKLFSTGHSKRSANLMLGQSEMIEMAVFDYRYTVGGGQSSATLLQTPACFFPHGLVFPQFRLVPENFFHRIGQAFGMKDFDFDSHPQFSRTYLLQGADESAVRDLFDRHVLDFFEANPGLSVEANGGIIVIYRDGKRSKPEQVMADVDLAKQVFAVFAPHATRAER